MGGAQAPLEAHPGRQEKDCGSQIGVESAVQSWLPRHAKHMCLRGWQRGALDGQSASALHWTHARVTGSQTVSGAAQSLAT